MSFRADDATAYRRVGQVCELKSCASDGADLHAHNTSAAGKGSFAARKPTHARVQSCVKTQGASTMDSKSIASTKRHYQCRVSDQAWSHSRFTARMFASPCCGVQQVPLRPAAARQGPACCLGAWPSCRVCVSVYADTTCYVRTRSDRLDFSSFPIAGMKSPCESPEFLARS